jgi:hypothetical protein
MDSPARLAPWLLIALLSSGTARAAQPDPLDFPARAAALEAAADPSSLLEAASLRRALGQPELAAADTARFFAHLAKDPASSAQAASAYLDQLPDLIDPDPGLDTAPERAALRRFLASLPASPAHAALRARAEIRLAARLWDASCTLPVEKRSDVACIQRFDTGDKYQPLTPAERAAFLPRRLPPGPPPEFCAVRPSISYVVHPRLPALASEAQSLLARALRRAEALPNSAQSPQLQDALAQARFLRAEPHFEAALTRTLPPEYRFLDHVPKHRLRVLNAWFSAWIDSRFVFGTGLREKYKAVTENVDTPWREEPPSPWTLAAHARLAQLHIDFEAQRQRVRLYHRPPPPTGMSVAEWAPIYHRFVCTETDEFVCNDPRRDHLVICISYALPFSLNNAFTRTCQDLLTRFSPDDELLHNEIRPAPTAQTSLLFRSEPGVTMR